MSSRTSIVVVIVLLALGVIYYFYDSGNSSALKNTGGSTNSTITTTGPNGAPITDNSEGAVAASVGADVLALLNRINSLKIDTKFFKDVSYQSLENFAVDIPPENVGRQNPFAPLSGVFVPLSTTTPPRR